MIEALLIVGLAAGLPMAYFRGRRSGYERHHCVWMPDPEDRAPQTFVAVALPDLRRGDRLRVAHRGRNGAGFAEPDRHHRHH